jgi:hypothetical protein
VNPSNPLVRAVLNKMIANRDYYFLALNPNGDVRVFRAASGEENLAGLKANLPRMLRSTTTDAQYRQAVSAFQKTPDPPGVLLDWVCRDRIEHLDLSSDRLDLNPA